MSDYSKTTAEQLITESLADEGRLALCQVESIDDIYCLDEDSMAVVLSVVARNRAMAEQLRAAVDEIDALGARLRLVPDDIARLLATRSARIDSLHSALGAALALTYVPTCSQDEAWAAERERLNRVLNGDEQ